MRLGPGDCALGVETVEFAWDKRITRAVQVQAAWNELAARVDSG